MLFQAFSFDSINCTELSNSSDTYDLDWPTYESQRLHPEQRKNIIFEISVWPVIADDVTMIQITTRRKTDTECIGMLLTHTCNLNPGAILYNLSLQGVRLCSQRAQLFGELRRSCCQPECCKWDHR